MQRRGGSGQPVKGQSANRPKARKAPTAQVSTADLQEQLDRLTRERDEALEQQAATVRGAAGHRPVHPAISSRCSRAIAAKAPRILCGRRSGLCVSTATALTLGCHSMGRKLAQRQCGSSTADESPTLGIRREPCIESNSVQVPDLQAADANSGSTAIVPAVWASNYARRSDAAGRRARSGDHHLSP